MFRAAFIILMLITLLAVPIETSSQDFSVPNINGDNDYRWNEYPGFVTPNADYQSLEDLHLFVQKAKKKRFRYKNETDFLRYVYYKVHRKYLGHYKTPSTFTNLLEQRTYDCLSGTALYAMIYGSLGVDYKIIETTFHVYLSLKVGQEKVLIESTSPLGGFISDQYLIEQLEHSYQTVDGSRVDQQIYTPVENVYGEISLEELAGLQYFNVAVAAYNQKDIKTAILRMSTALELYPSSRLKEMLVVMLNTLATDKKVDPLFRQHYLSKYDYLRSTIITAYGR